MNSPQLSTLRLLPSLLAEAKERGRRGASSSSFTVNICDRNTETPMDKTGTAARQTGEMAISRHRVRCKTPVVIAAMALASEHSLWERECDLH
jgi:hypothetical protein